MSIHAAVCSVVADASASAARYDLCATVNHVGSLGFGHYTAAAPIRGDWYAFDDAHVRRLPASADVASANSYLLFYKRC